MSREQRIDDNWALLHALELSGGSDKLEIIFTLTSESSGFTARSFQFCINGLKEVEDRALALGIKFSLLTGEKPAGMILDYLKGKDAGAVVCDFNPLRENLIICKEIAKKLLIPVIEVDGRNIVPCRYISAKQEFGAHTLRRKIEAVLPAFLVPFPSIEELSGDSGRKDVKAESRTDWNNIISKFCPTGSPGPVTAPVPGYTAATELLNNFIEKKLSDYAGKRNDPNMYAQSGLSPYLHFGQISAQSAALAAARVEYFPSLKNSFLDELVVRRELSDNFCLHNQFYDSFEGFPDWAKHSLKVHSVDKREYLYSTNQLEQADTHDELWNASQRQLIRDGKMHGYMRMYWAKKILEWSPDAAEAMRRAVFLNDKYSLDGHDSNGYAGCAWAIGGLHDRAWAERSVFGKIRYMNYNGCRRKFDVDAYTAKYSIDLPS